MLDIRRIRENEDEVRQGLETRGAGTEAVDNCLALSGRKRALLTEVETLKAERNKASKEIGALKKQGKDTNDSQASVRALGERIAALDNDVQKADKDLKDLLHGIPNVPHPSVPVGPDESANKDVRSWGEPQTYDFAPRNHMELGEKLGVLDFARATKMTGPGFPLLLGMGARLERALIAFMLDIHTREHGYTEICPPVLCNTAAMTGTAQLPKMAEDMYALPEDGLCLIPTAEVPLTNYYREEIIDQPLPVRLTAATVCFRREAGAAGKETRGFIRVHQFEKVEMVKFVEPETSYAELESLVTDAEDVLQRLELPYRIRELCTGDITFASAKCYDLELWAPGQNDWLEVSSCSNFEDFQARRAGIRYRDKNGKVQYVHTLNGSGVALPRLIVAILESGQQKDGSVALPKAIVPYMGGIETLEPKPE